MKKPRLLGVVFSCVLITYAFSVSAEIITYNFTGTVTDAGNIGGVSASVDDVITGEFTYDTATLDSNPGDTTAGDYINSTITPPLKIILPSGSITFDPGLSVLVTKLTSINIVAGVPDPTVEGNNIDIDIIFSGLKASSTALATDALPTNIDLNDFDSATGAFSSFSVENGPAGDPIFFSIDTLTVRAVTIEYELGGGWAYEPEYPDTVEVTDNPKGGVTVSINVPSGIYDGGLTASIHSLPGFSLIDGVFIELEYNSLSSTIDGNAAYSDLNLELELFDEELALYQIGMNLSTGAGSISFESWFEKESFDGNPVFNNYESAPVPDGVVTDQGALGLFVTGASMIPYFKDAGGDLTFPFAGWDISQIIGAHDFSVDNDFEADTFEGGSVMGSVNLERVVYGIASLVRIDEFSIVKNGNTIFQDSFENNIAPPDTGGNSQSYRVYGVPLSPEAGGKLTLSAANGENVTRPDVGAMARQGARVNTNTDPSQPDNGLRTDDLFSVTGIFDIAMPTETRERYGVRLNDSGSSVHNGSIGLSVMRTSASLVEIVLHHYDQTAFTLTDLATVPLESGHDQVALTLSRDDPGNNELTASFAYLDAGVMGSTTTIPTTATIFDGEDFVRAAFMYLVPVPDVDVDGVADQIDNCTNIQNTDQLDTDGDGFGNLCDGDLNDDGSTNTLDLNLYKQAHRTSVGDANYDVDADFNGDGTINTLDLNIYKGLHRQPPGPSCCGVY